MKLFFVLTPQSNQYAPVLRKSGVKHILCSYAIANKIKHYDNILEGAELLVDSGAFSAWTIDKKIDLYEYIDFCKELNSVYRKRLKIKFINLDIIPSKFGVKPDLKDVQMSAEKGWQNYEIMKKAGIDAMHTFHMYEDFKWLDKLMKYGGGYIGISPANDAPLNDRLAWLKKVTYKVRNKVKTHCLGLTAHKILKEVPLYSADSASWLLGVMYGISLNFKKGSLVMDRDFYSRHRGKFDYDRLLSNNIKAVLKSEKYLTDLWNARGIKWE